MEDIKQTIVRLGRTLDAIHELRERRRVTEFGVRVLRGAKNPRLKGLVVRWGKDIPKGEMTAAGEGAMHIQDPVSKAEISVRRTKEPFEEYLNEPGEWVGGKNMEVGHLYVPKAKRETLEGGKGLKKVTDAVFNHADKTNTMLYTKASAFENHTIKDRADETYKLYHGYAKRGFQIDPTPGLPNKFNVPMSRDPGAEVPKILTRKQFDRHMDRQVDKTVKYTGRELKKTLKVPGSVQASGVAYTGGMGYAASQAQNDKEHKTNARLGLAAGAGLGLAAGGAMVASRGPQILSALKDHAGSLRIKVGEKIGDNRIGRALLKGYV